MEKNTDWSSQTVYPQFLKKLVRYTRRRCLSKNVPRVYILGLWLVLTQTMPLFAQDLQVDLSVPAQGVDNFSVCGAAKPISLTIENILTDTLTDVTVSIPLLTGFAYVNTSLSGDATLLSAVTPKPLPILI